MQRGYFQTFIPTKIMPPGAYKYFISEFDKSVLTDPSLKIEFDLDRFEYWKHYWLLS